MASVADAFAKTRAQAPKKPFPAINGVPAPGQITPAPQMTFLDRLRSAMGLSPEPPQVRPDVMGDRG